MKEPFRLLFPLGVLLAWIGIGHWLLYTTGVTETYSCVAHGLVQTGAFMLSFALGFLFTAVPRRTGTAPPSATELALAAAARLPAGWALLAAGTDGIDGRTPAAGAFADVAVRSIGSRSIARALREHDTYRLLAPAGHALITGPTGTNVMDVVVALHPGR